MVLAIVSCAECPLGARAAGRAILPGDGRLCTVMPSLPLSPGRHEGYC